MDEDTRKLLEETAELTRENNVMLKKLRSSQKNARMLKGIYWVVVIALTYMAYAYAKPYFDQTKAFYSAAEQQLQSFKDVTGRK